jgi:catechol 2,3-dioxygenase-like lactoylglutathione lyase family enzyme
MGRDASRVEIGARLAALDILSGDPAGLARFYGQTFGLVARQDGAAFECLAPQRRITFRPGQAGQLDRMAFVFSTRAEFERHRDALRSRELACCDQGPDHHAVLDPLGCRVEFLAPSAAGDADAASASGPLPARLQHLGVRAPRPLELVRFYVDMLGFVLSDRVLDAQGDLTAAFLRTDAEHHCLAIFRAPVARFDHFSCETTDWEHLRHWADHMAEVGVDLAWGIGRHGPGNDTFLMVKDVDGNMGEVSCDLEVCAPERPAGQWAHRPQTLNRWGVALMRS